MEKAKNNDLDVKDSGKIKVEGDEGERLNALCTAFSMKNREWKR
jgi:hypothetical protein